MLMGTIRLSTSLLLSLLFCAQAPAQAPATSRTQGPMVRPDPKRAQKAVERGDKAQAAGNLDEALLTYEEAARDAPNEGHALERGAALPSSLVCANMRAPERVASPGAVPQTTRDL